MIIDAAQLSSLDGVFDVCIVGAGAAGITLALELAAKGRRVCVLEAGAESYTSTAQRLLEGSVEGDPYPPLRSTRMSAFGGTTHVWAGWCRTLDGVDFEARPALGQVAWPFGRDELLPHYRRAHELCGLAEFEYDPHHWYKKLGRQPLIENLEELVHCVFHVRVQNLAVVFRQRLEQAPNVAVVLRAPVTRVDVDPAGQVRSVRVHRPGTDDVPVAARQYVLAAGGIENARLLLLSATTPEQAPGNRNGLVGRFFTDHPFINPGALVLRGEPRRLDFYFPQLVPGADGAAVRATLSFPRETFAREGLFSAVMFFHPRYESHAVFASPEVRALLEWRDTLRSRAVPGATARLLRRAIRRPDRIAVAGLRKLVVRDGPARRWRVRMMFETASRFENRVTLDPRRDELGRPRARVEWRLGDGEISGMRRSLALFDAAFRRTGIGHIERSLADNDEAWRRALEGGKHHMGTTRMHADPAQGVVDSDGRVHGTRNLYVTGSSVFPSGGYANPTLTIIALASRLAEHLNHPAT
jgi:choline dehydrogenase-like flavoprotein